MIKKFFAVLSILSLTIFSPFYQAQAQLSQLEFDGPSRQVGQQALRKKQKLESALKTILDKEQSENARARLAEPKPVSLKKEEAPVKEATPKVELAKEEYRKEVLIGGERSEIHNLTPRLKGPFIDKGENSLITSKYRWNKLAGSCGHPKERAEVLNKAGAIKEILFRFSGNNEAHDALVEQHCSTDCASSQEAKLVGLAVESARGGEFRIAQDTTSCTYQLSKEGESEWKKLEVSKIVCGCFNR